MNEDWAWFVGDNRETIRLTTKPEPYTLQKALHWLQRQVAPTIKMVQAFDRENHTTILKDMIEQAEPKDKHKHLLQLEKSTIEEHRKKNGIVTVVANSSSHFSRIAAILFKKKNAIINSFTGQINFTFSLIKKLCIMVIIVQSFYYLNLLSIETR